MLEMIFCHPLESRILLLRKIWLNGPRIRIYTLEFPVIVGHDGPLDIHKQMR